MCMAISSLDTVDFETATLRLYEDLQALVPEELPVDELDVEQEPGLAIEMMAPYVMKYHPDLPQGYRDAIEEVMGQIF